MNIVVYGVREDQDTSVWRKFVLDALEHVAGHTVDTNDMFRVGRFVVGRMRLVIVKLRSMWDRRLLVSGSYKPKNFREQVFYSSR